MSAVHSYGCLPQGYLVKRLSMDKSWMAPWCFGIGNIGVCTFSTMWQSRPRLVKFLQKLCQDHCHSVIRLVIERKLRLLMHP